MNTTHFPSATGAARAANPLQIGDVLDVRDLEVLQACLDPAPVRWKTTVHAPSLPFSPSSFYEATVPVTARFSQS